MSTAGKVLVGVVVLALIGWIVLFSLVYELNTNWGKEMDRLTAQIQKLEQDTKAQAVTLENTLAELSQEQIQRDTDVEVLRGLLSHAEKLATQNLEATERVRLQVAGLEAAHRDAAEQVKNRIAEKAQTQKDLATAEETVKTLQGEVQGQLDQLSTLRENFLQTMDENQKLIDRMRQPLGRSAQRSSPVVR